MAEPHLTLVVGPSRSGKSRWAEHLALASERPVTYVATASNDSQDSLWQERVRQHRRRRPPSWTTMEVGFDLAQSLDGMGNGHLALVDSLGTWVAWGLELDQSRWDAACFQLLQSIRDCASPVIVVSEQAGWGVVPPTAIGGLFRDRLGSVEQQMMALATAAWLVVAGRAIDLFDASVPVPP